VRVELRSAWRGRRPYKIIFAIVAVVVCEGTFLNYLPNLSYFKLLEALSTGQRNDFSNMLAGVAKPKVLRGR
jgi:hypothetical protein